MPGTMGLHRVSIINARADPVDGLWYTSGNPNRFAVAALAATIIESQTPIDRLMIRDTPGGSVLFDWPQQAHGTGTYVGIDRVRMDLIATPCGVFHTNLFHYTGQAPPGENGDRPHPSNGDMSGYAHQVSAPLIVR
jgi:hypothetical protein